MKPFPIKARVVIESVTITTTMIEDMVSRKRVVTVVLVSISKLHSPYVSHLMAILKSNKGCPIDKVSQLKYFENIQVDTLYDRRDLPLISFYTIETLNESLLT